MADWFLSYWTNLSVSEIREDKYLLIYMALVIALIIGAAVRTVFFAFACIRVSRRRRRVIVMLQELEETRCFGFASVMAEWAHAGGFLYTFISLSLSLSFSLSLSLSFSLSLSLSFFLPPSSGHSRPQASQGLHDQSFFTVLHAPMRFFDTNPVGRIVNRFSKDLALIDDMMPWTLLDFLQVCVSVCVCVCVCACMLRDGNLDALFPSPISHLFHQ
jgi:ABC-type multidrug transport system fused ATPase/permease subunit